jgi:hypothetical protein
MAERGIQEGAPESAPAEDRNTAWAVRELETALRGLRYGEVKVIVQDGVVVQVERTERKRFGRSQG